MSTVKALTTSESAAAISAGALDVGLLEHVLVGRIAEEDGVPGVARPFADILVAVDDEERLTAARELAGDLLTDPPESAYDDVVSHLA